MRFITFFMVLWFVYLQSKVIPKVQQFKSIPIFKTIMQHQQKYTLHWHSYSDHLRETLNEMLLSSEFADVTLVTDDKQKIRAHRNILSACSPVFKSILQFDSNNTNPVIYLRGVQHSEMESIMKFVYLLWERQDIMKKE